MPASCSSEPRPTSSRAKPSGSSVDGDSDCDPDAAAECAAQRPCRALQMLDDDQVRHEQRQEQLQRRAQIAAATRS